MRATPGLYHEMKERMRVETDPFTLFAVATDQGAPRDVRQVAGNRINALHKSVADKYLSEETDSEILAAIGRCSFVPPWFASYAKARAASMKRPEADRDDYTTRRLIELATEQNRLLKRILYGGMRQ